MHSTEELPFVTKNIIDLRLEANRMNLFPRAHGPQIDSGKWYRWTTINKKSGILTVLQF